LKRNFLKLVVLVLFVLSLGACSQKIIYQIDGQPMPNNIIQASIISIQTKIKYNLIRTFSIEEGDESYTSYEFLSLFNTSLNKVQKTDKLCMTIQIFNPEKNEYRMESTLQVEGLETKIEPMYNGNISRNVFTLDLPMHSNKMVVFYYTVYDKDDNLVFQSFKAQYIVEG